MSDGGRVRACHPIQMYGSSNYITIIRTTNRIIVTYIWSTCVGYICWCKCYKRSIMLLNVFNWTFIGWNEQQHRIKPHSAGEVCRKAPFDWFSQCRVHLFVSCVLLHLIISPTLALTSKPIDLYDPFLFCWFFASLASIKLNRSIALWQQFRLRLWAEILLRRNGCFRSHCDYVERLPSIYKALIWLKWQFMKSTWFLL